jgi:hypothetical protein
MSETRVFSVKAFRAEIMLHRKRIRKQAMTIVLSGDGAARQTWDDTDEHHSLERRLCYNAEGAPDGPALFTVDSSVNIEYILMESTPHRICKTTHIFPLNLRNISRNPEEGAYSLSWPNGLIIIIN